MKSSLLNQDISLIPDYLENLPPADLDLPLIPLNIVNNSFTSNQATVQLLERVGGPKAIMRMTERFYHEYLFKDSVLDEFVTSHGDPHGQRLAQYFVQKMNPELNSWDVNKAARGDAGADVHDRTSAHVAAWNSPKRPAHRRGRRFKLDDARIWMRSLFAAARDVGLLENRPFADWFTKFIGHFVAVYERSAQVFARESKRWSSNPQNVEAYIAGGRISDVIGVPYNQAVADLSAQERNDNYWPYGL